MLLGYPTSGSMAVVTNFDDFVRYYGGFVQDDYRVTPKLTLNFGLRFEYESGVREANNKLITGFDAAALSPLPQSIAGRQILGQVQYAGVNGNPTETGNVLSVKPAPRFGFAYSPDSKNRYSRGIRHLLGSRLLQFSKCDRLFADDLDRRFHQRQLHTCRIAHESLSEWTLATDRKFSRRSFRYWASDYRLFAQHEFLRIRAAILARSAAAGSGRIRADCGRFGVALAPFTRVWAEYQSAQSGVLIAWLSAHAERLESALQ